VSLPEVLRTATFRNAALISGIFGLATLLLFAFIFWQTAGYEGRRIDMFLQYEASALAHEPPARLIGDITAKFAGDLHRTTFATLFATDGKPVAGDLVAVPRGLKLDGSPHHVIAERMAGGDDAVEAVRAVGIKLADGRLLIVGRSEAALAELRAVIARALTLGLMPALLFALLAGTFASRRALARVKTINSTIQRIMDGGLHERLPTANSHDVLDQLAGRVNDMLNEIERLLLEVKGVGDGIAHDVRTPLARLRTRLEGGRRRAADQAALQAVVDQALTDLDQAFAIITSLLRIGEIEGARRRAGFGRVSLKQILHEAAELYLPVAELQDISLEADAPTDHEVFADRDLLFEAVANLVDNAVKFAPSGGQMRLSLWQDGTDPVLRVWDSGAGIPPQEQAATLQRFYRSDRSRHIHGSGLGLSLVAAILRLHGFRLAMHNLEQGFAVDVICGAATRR
jgi:signal transduction histidine kinase